MKSLKSISFGASAQRLNDLIQKRLEPGVDKEEIDKRIWDLFGEKWCIMFTDLSGFSRNVAEFGVIHFLQIIFESERLLIPIIEEHDGILLKVEGDSFMVIFRNVNKAMACSLEMQRVLKEYNIDKSEEEKIYLCLGLGYGDVLRIGDSDVYGCEVNAASKLGEDIAGPKEILVTESVVSAIEMDLKFEEIDDVPPGAKKAYTTLYEV